MNPEPDNLSSYENPNSGRLAMYPYECFAKTKNTPLDFLCGRMYSLLKGNFLIFLSSANLLACLARPALLFSWACGAPRGEAQKEEQR